MPPKFFPDADWQRTRTLVSGLYIMHAHTSLNGDVALSINEALTPDMWGTIIVISRHGDGDFWLRSRHVTAYMNTTWQMRRNHVGKMEFRSTGYHDTMGPCVCLCVGESSFNDYLCEVLGPGFAEFSTAAVAAILNELRVRSLPMRLREILPSRGIKGDRIDAIVDTNRDHELIEKD